MGRGRQPSSIRVSRVEHDEPSDIDLSVTSHPVHAISDLDDDATSRADLQELGAIDTSDSENISNNLTNVYSHSHSHTLPFHSSHHSQEDLHALMDDKDSQNVTRWKTFVMTLLLVNAGLVTIATFEVLRREEEAEFRTAVSDI